MCTLQLQCPMKQKLRSGQYQAYLDADPTNQTHSCKRQAFNFVVTKTISAILTTFYSLNLLPV